MRFSVHALATSAFSIAASASAVPITGSSNIQQRADASGVIAPASTKWPVKWTCKAPGKVACETTGGSPEDADVGLILDGAPSHGGWKAFKDLQEGSKSGAWSGYQTNTAEITS